MACVKKNKHHPIAKVECVQKNFGLEHSHKLFLLISFVQVVLFQGFLSHIVAY